MNTSYIHPPSYPQYTNYFSLLAGTNREQTFCFLLFYRFINREKLLAAPAAKGRILLCFLTSFYFFKALSEKFIIQGETTLNNEKLIQLFKQLHQLLPLSHYMLLFFVYEKFIAIPAGKVIKYFMLLYFLLLFQISCEKSFQY